MAEFAFALHAFIEEDVRQVQDRLARTIDSARDIGNLRAAAKALPEPLAVIVLNSQYRGSLMASLRHDIEVPRDISPELRLSRKNTTPAVEETWKAKAGSQTTKEHSMRV